MSTTDLYILNKRSVTHFAEFRNSWGSAPVVWDYLSKKYIPETPIYGLEQSHMDKVWALARDERLERDEKVALLFTFDAAFIPKEHLFTAADALESFYLKTARHEYVNHWRDIASSLRRMARAKLSRWARGACISCTSVSNNWEYGTDWPADAWPIFEVKS